MTIRVPEDFHTITPQLVVSGVADAIAWYTTALGDEFPGSMRSPVSLGGSAVTLHLYVHDVDAVFNRAVDAGATVLMPVSDQFWGDRYGILADPFGHRWSIASRIEDLSPNDMHKRAESWAKEQQS
jgi:PhnB protein